MHFFHINYTKIDKKKENNNFFMVFRIHVAGENLGEHKNQAITHLPNIQHWKNMLKVFLVSKAPFF